MKYTKLKCTILFALLLLSKCLFRKIKRDKNGLQKSEFKRKNIKFLIKSLSKSEQTYLKNIDYAFKGYDAIKGNPHTNSVDPGFRGRIFVPDFIKKETTADQVWMVPEGVEIVKVESCDTNSTFQEIKGAASYQSSLSLDASISGGIGMFAFQASAGFKDVSERTKETGSTFIEDKADCKLYKVTINIYSPPKFHANFITGLKTLGLYPQTKDKFCKFFKYFGTHVPESIVLGARFGHITQIDTNSNSSSKETTVNASIGASYAGIGGKVSTEVSNKNSDSNSSLIKNKKSFSIGSKPEEEGHGLKWAQKEIEAPMPIQYEMMEITRALELTGKKQELTEGGIANADGLIVEMNKALKSYCEDCLVPAGLISNCEAAKDVASNAKITIVQTNTPYLLKNVETGNCLTFTSRTNFVESKPCTNEQSQKWKLENAEGYYKVKTLQEDSVLDVPGAVSDEGTAMKAYDTPKDKIYKNQVFKFLLDRTNGLYTIEPLYVKKCLQIQDDSIFSGARVIMMTCNGKRSQQWRVVTI